MDCRFKEPMTQKVFDSSVLSEILCLSHLLTNRDQRTYLGRQIVFRVRKVRKKTKKPRPIL